MSGSVTGSDCDWSGCREPGTHQVHVEHSDGRNEDLRLCRDHDDAIKARVRQEVGPKPSEPPPPTLPATVACGNAGACWTNRRDCQQISASRARTADLPSARS